MAVLQRRAQLSHPAGGARPRPEHFPTSSRLRLGEMISVSPVIVSTVIVSETEGSFGNSARCPGLMGTVLSQRGFRTMVVGCRRLTDADLQIARKRLREARHNMTSTRATVVAEAYRVVESGLTVMGATAVEDKLQPLVQETLEALRVASVKVKSSSCTELRRRQSDASI